MIDFQFMSCVDYCDVLLSDVVTLILVAPIHCRGSNGEQVMYCKGPCTLSPKLSYFIFFIFVILSYQNACYGCENTGNQTWSDFFYDGRKFQRQWVNVIDTTWGRIYFSTCENFGQKFLTKFHLTKSVLIKNIIMYTLHGLRANFYFWVNCSFKEQTLQSKSKSSAVVHCYPHDRQTNSNLDSNTVFCRT